MGLLKNIGMVLIKATALVAGFDPLLRPLIGATGGERAQRTYDTVAADLARIADIIVKVEAIGQVLGTKGQDKLRAAGPLVAQVILSSSVVAGRKIADEAKFATACETIAGGMADLLNSLEADVKAVAPQNLVG